MLKLVEQVERVLLCQPVVVLADCADQAICHWKPSHALWKLFRICSGTHQVRRNIRFIADDPTVVSWCDMENVTSLYLNDASIVHCCGGASLDHDTDVFHITSLLAEHPSDVLGPLPSRLIRRAAEGHSSDVNDLELSLGERPDLVRIVESLQGHIHGGTSDHQNKIMVPHKSSRSLAGSCRGRALQRVEGKIQQDRIRPAAYDRRGQERAV